MFRNIKLSSHDTAKPLRSFMIDDSVYVQDFSSPTLSWISGKIVKVSGPLFYHVELQSGRVVCRYVDAVRKRVASHLPLVTSSPSVDGEDLYLPNVPQTHPDTQETARAPTLPLPTLNAPQQCDQPPNCRSTHHRPPPDRLNYSLRGGSVITTKELQKHVDCNTSCHFHSCTTSHQLTTLSYLMHA